MNCPHHKYRPRTKKDGTLTRPPAYVRPCFYCDVMLELAQLRQEQERSNRNLAAAHSAADSALFVANTWSHRYH